MSGKVNVDRNVLAELLSIAQSYYGEYGFRDLNMSAMTADDEGKEHYARIETLARLQREVEYGERDAVDVADWPAPDRGEAQP